MIRDRLTAAKIAAVTVLAVFALSVAPAASAHTSLVSATPADGDVLTEPASLRLEFSEELLTIGDSAKITSADGTTVDLVIDLSVPRVLSAPLPQDLSAGEYVINWRVVANDGHPLEDTIDFTYAPTGGASADSTSPSASATPTPLATMSQATEATSSAATSSANAAASASASPSAAASDAPVSANGSGDSGSSVWWWIVAIGLVLGIGIGVWVWRTGRSAPVDEGIATAEPKDPHDSGDSTTS